MNIKEVINSGKVDFTGIEQSYFLLGLLSAFDNRFQAVADGTMKAIRESSVLSLPIIAERFVQKMMK